MESYLKGTVFLLLCGLAVLQQGCVENREEMQKKILAHDPSFQESLEKRNSLQEKLDLQKAAYLRKKIEIEGEINALKEKSVQAKEEYATYAEDTKRQIEPDKRHLKQDLLEMKNRYELKKAELGSVNRDINEIDSLIKRKDRLALTPEEIQTWNKRLASLIEKKAEVEADLDKFKKEIEITNLKIKVLDLK
jgi:hypothetical protein